MSPTDRLAELRRQRALLQQHSDWLDGEIAAAQAGLPPVANPPPAAASTTLSAAISPLPSPTPGPAPALDPDAILSQYRSDESRLKTDVRKGCLLYSAVAFGFLILGVFVLYFLLRRAPG
jgi:hypothetical protein